MWPIPNPVSTGLPHPMSYDVSNAGYVIDNVTKLWWQHPIDQNNSEQKNCSTGCTQADAIAYCQNLSLAGHSDWRLPTRIELVSLVDYATSNPAINSAFSGTPEAAFWTSSAYALAGHAWSVYFSNGATDHGTVSNTNRVRCVR
jgi:hypothetical protein